MDSIGEILSKIINIFIDIVPRPFFIGVKEGGIMFFNPLEIWILTFFIVLIFGLIIHRYKVHHKKDIIKDHPIISYLLLIIISSIFLFATIYSCFFDRDDNNIITLNPGIHLYWPMASKIEKIYTQKLSLNITSQGITTLDNKNIVASGVVFYDISNVKSALYDYINIHDYIHDEALIIIKDIFSKYSLFDIMKNNININKEMNLKLKGEFDESIFNFIKIDISDISEGIILKTNGNDNVIYLQN